MTRNRRALVSFALAIAAGSWGLYWLPQRMFQDAGMTGGWGTLTQYILCVLLLTPFVLSNAMRGRPTGLKMPLIGLLMGGGIMCYGNSFLLTDVMRVLLLFYLAPLWATLLEIGITRKRPHWSRAISLSAAVAGVWVVLGQDAGLPLPENTGDWLALAGGILFAAGAARINTVQPKGITPTLFVFFLYGGLVGVVQLPLLAGHLGPAPAAANLVAMLPWLVALSACFFIPTNVVIMGAPRFIGVGLFGILILTELVFGTISAALWANEPFGWREILGASLILGGGIVEVLLAPTSEPAQAPG